MSVEEVLSLVTTKLEECGIRYMITGSFASNLYGVPRATQDADIVVEIEPVAIDKLSLELGSSFYFDTEIAKRSLATPGIFNLIHYESGFKIDLIVRKNRKFSLQEFQRRQQTPFAGKLSWFASAEDTILAKLEWSKLGQSERQFLDAVNIARVQGDKLDLAYLRQSAEELNLKDLLSRLLTQTD